MNPLPAVSVRPPSHVGDVCELSSVGQAGHHALQLGADDGILVLPLLGQPLVVFQGALWRCSCGQNLPRRHQGGRGGPVWPRDIWRDGGRVLWELNVGLGVTVCQ